MKTLVVGATGLLGPEICQRLSSAGHAVRALVRPSTDAGKLAPLQACGAELVEGDLKDAASLARACDGVEAILSTATSTMSRREGDSIESVDHRGQLALVSAARTAGVGRFVFVSFRENPAIQFPLGTAKRAVERALVSSGMDYTILQASWFMEVWLSPALGFDIATRRVRIYGDGSQPISWISCHDVAHAAAAAVIDNVGRNAIVELGGPQALSPLDVVRQFEEAGTGTIAVEHVPVDALRAQLDSSTDALEQSFAGLMLQYASGDAIDPAAARRLFQFPMTSVRDVAASQLAAAG